MINKIFYPLQLHSHTHIFTRNNVEAIFFASTGRRSNSHRKASISIICTLISKTRETSNGVIYTAANHSTADYTLSKRTKRNQSHNLLRDGANLSICLIHNLNFTLTANHLQTTMIKDISRFWNNHKA